MNRCSLIILFLIGVSYGLLSSSTNNLSYSTVDYWAILEESDIKYLSFKDVYVEFGQNIGRHVRRRILNHLLSVRSSKIHVVTNAEVFLNSLSNTENNVTENSLILAFGNSSFSLMNIPQKDLMTLPPESYKILFNSLRKGIYSLSANGNPLSLEVSKNVSFNPHIIHYGAIAGSYAALELLGFAFLHPLEPYIPSSIQFPVVRNDDTYFSYPLTFVESPYWSRRGFHLHTQHPLELTEVLQGHDIPQFGPHGNDCKQFSQLSSSYRFHEGSRVSSPSAVNSSYINANKTTYCERWEDMVIDVDSFYEWSIANGLNMIEWLLLGSISWGDELAIRSNRLKKLTTLGHQYSLLIGAVVPIGNIQQHGWYMVNVRLPIEQQKQQIRSRIDWIFHTEFDFLTTESGLSEFTHPECDLMIELFNTFAQHVNETWGRFAATKVHCSTGQFCSDYLDLRNGDPVNFNFLPSFTHTGLGVYPHTVQMYSFDDPSAGSYGNNNFGYIEDYLVYEGKQGKRSVLYYGETSYWVNVDIDVPLFLPIYGQRRQKDLRKIALTEQTEHFKIAGQMNFDSGWEWGYWLNDVITARSSWNPQITESTIAEFSNCENDPTVCPPSSDQWKEYSKALYAYFTRIYGSLSFSKKLTSFLVELSELQANLLIHSYINGRPNPFLPKLSGIAYLCGSDTWTELPRLFGLHLTQPDKVQIKESDDPNWAYVLELLKEMEDKFGNFSTQITALYLELEEYRQIENGGNFVINAQAMLFLSEVKDSTHLLYLRAKHVHLLYLSNDADLMLESKKRKSLLEEGRSVIEEATEIVKRRESSYRSPVERVAGWRDNPTVYRYGYLWSVHSLYYWWRDQGIAETLAKDKEHSPCYLNRMDSTEVAVGWGKSTLEWLRYFVTNYSPFASVFPLEIVHCLSSTSKEYVFPRDL
jgi:hypothetical protein